MNTNTAMRIDESQSATVPAIKAPDKMAIVNPIVDEAKSLVVVTVEDVDVARSLGKRINTMIATIKDDFKASKEAADKAHKVICAQEKNHLDPLDSAKRLVAGKISTWDTAERNRIAEEQRKEREAEEKRRNLALAAAQKKLDKLKESAANETALLAQLTESLDSDTLSDEEAQVIRAEIQTIETKINATMDKVQAVEQKVEEVAQPVMMEAPVQNIKTATGVKQVKEVTSVNMKTLVRWLASPDCPVDPDTLLKVQDGALKQMIQRMNIPGVSWSFKSTARF